MIDQERQLELRRRDEQQRQLLIQVRQELFTSLEKQKLQEIKRVVSGNAGTWQPPVVFAGTLRDGHLILPWEDDANIRKFIQSIGEPEYAKWLQKAETDEFVSHSYSQAIQHSQAAIASASQPAQQSYARLLLARSLEKAGRHAESLKEYKRILASPMDLVDESGVPLALYAAPPLITAGVWQKETIELLDIVAKGEHPLSPAALYLARQLAGTVGAANIEAQLDSQIKDAEQTEALQRDAPHLTALSETQDPVWKSGDGGINSPGRINTPVP
jgi:tetratricopeptide (TPR) repeat protein